MDREQYTEINARTIDRWVDEGWEWGVPLTREAFKKARDGAWEVLLTPEKPVPRAWFPAFPGKKLLGLACGGGQQMPVFAAQGASCTVLDYSERQLAQERLVAEREGYGIEIIKADMTKKLPFADGIFDIIFHPVSNCYIEDVYHVWNECFRILKPGGVLMAGMDNGLNFLFDDDSKAPLTVRNKLPFNPLKDESLYKKLRENDDGIQFSHSLEEQIGGQIRAGFFLKDLYEDYNNTGVLREYAPSYLATLAQKPVDRHSRPAAL
ncbi:MAG: class I SAM-dependent methyltransferase [Spirochaetaceae bacterium]|nr:class I SAM-dependent methyltransferase [Spirochaetaceae bacterium]